MRSSVLSPGDQGRPGGWSGQEDDPARSSRGKCDGDLLLFRREIEIDEIVRHYFLGLFIGFTESERIAGFVVFVICLRFLTQKLGSGENLLTSIHSVRNA
jgi:hypothetical protein